MRKFIIGLQVATLLLWISQTVVAVTPEELGRMLLGSNYKGITQGYDVYYAEGPTSKTTKGGWHPGIDYKAQSPLPIYSPISGVVDSFDPQGTSFGRVAVKITGTNDYFIFLHLSKVSVKKDQKISVGDIIGNTGSTGAPDAHLHVEVRTGRSGAAYYFPASDKTGVNKDPSSVVNSKTPAPEVRSDIRKIDFRNFTYQVRAFSARGQTAQLRKGEFSSEDLNCRFDKVIYGDLDGDGRSEAVVSLLCDAGGTAGASEGYVYTMAGDRAVLLAGFVSNGGDDGIGTRDISISNGLLVVDRFVPGNNDSNCCPSYHRSTTYRLSGNNLNKVSQSQLTKIQ